MKCNLSKMRQQSTQIQPFFDQWFDEEGSSSPLASRGLTPSGSKTTPDLNAVDYVSDAFLFCIPSL